MKKFRFLAVLVLTAVLLSAFSGLLSVRASTAEFVAGSVNETAQESVIFGTVGDSRQDIDANTDEKARQGMNTNTAVGEPSQDSAVKAAELGGARMITVVGQGRAEVTPDRVRIILGVESKAGTAQAALSANSALAEAVVAAVLQAGVKHEDIRTCELNLYQNYDYTQYGSIPRGYAASNTVRLTMDSAAAADAVIAAAMGAGANRVNGIEFVVSDESEAYERALDKACADAKAKAERIAAATGLTVKSAVRITEGSAGSVRAYDSKYRVMSAESAVIYTGTQEVTAIVEMVFECE